MIMNLPISDHLVVNFPVSKLVSEKLFLELKTKKFTGYSYITIYQENGFEESILFFLNGKIVGCIYVIDNLDLYLYGKDAFSLCLNVFEVNDGVYNLFSLTDDQLKLILLFNEKIKFEKDISDVKFTKEVLAYNKQRREIFFKDVPSDGFQKKDLFNKFNISDLLKG